MNVRPWSSLVKEFSAKRLGPSKPKTRVRIPPAAPEFSSNLAGLISN